MGHPKHGDKGEVIDGRYVAPEDLEDAPRAFLEATAGLVGAPAGREESRGAEVTDGVPAGGHFEELLSGVKTDLRMGLDRAAGADLMPVGPVETDGWRERWANRWDELSEIAGRVPLRVKTEPVLHDPRPVKVRLHGKEYSLHRVVHGQVYGCAEANRPPGSILPPTLSLLPPTI